MTPERWQQLKSVLEAVESAAEGDRDGVLEKLCAGDPELRREVEPYLAETGTETFIQSAIGEHAASMFPPRVSSREDGFGRYRLVGRLGEGGMGVVYEAVRVDDFHKKVAIKIIRQGLDSDVARARFVRERQTLAGLEHPYIARLLDGGETEDGSPYLVLEFVEGVSITRYAESLDRVARLRLFLKVCEAVEYAHRNLVVHRDLKPANILVTAAGEPKLLDFGIAKLLDASDGGSTRTAFTALTPDYASPEQVRGESITTASDVYALGVILYQLLTGRKPYVLDSGTAAEMDRVICTGTPVAPGLGDELDHILLMALRKEPERRYNGVQRLAEDIERYLDNRPVLARPDSVGYRTQKFVRRNWWQLAAATLVVVSLAVGLGFSLAAQRRADRRFQQVRQLANRFLFDFHDEIAKTPGNVKAREMIVSTAQEYLNSLAGDAAGDPGLQWELAVAYGKVGAVQGSTVRPSLGRIGDAMASYRKALALARPLADQGRLTELQRGMMVIQICDLAAMHRSLQEYPTALQLNREGVARSHGLPGNAERRALSELASTLGRSGDLLGSVEIRAKLVPLTRETARVSPSFENRWALVANLVDLGYFQSKLTRFSEAIANEMEALQLADVLAAEAPAHVGIRSTRLNGLIFLALAEGAADRPSFGDTAKARALFEQVLGEYEAAIAADGHDASAKNESGRTHGYLAYLLRYSEPDEAIRHAAAAAKALDATGPVGGTNVAWMKIVAADAMRAKGDFPGAESMLKAAELLNPESPQFSWARLEIARGNRQAVAGRLARAIAGAEQDLSEAATPGNAFTVAAILDVAATAEPESALVRRQRAVAVWADQNQRFPGNVYIENRLASAVDALQRLQR